MARKICGIVQIYVRVIGDVKLAANYNAVISLGKEGQTTISHHGKVFAIDHVVDVEKEGNVLTAETIPLVRCGAFLLV